METEPSLFERDSASARRARQAEGRQRGAALRPAQPRQHVQRRLALHQQCRHARYDSTRNQVGVRAFFFLKRIPASLFYVRPYFAQLFTLLSCFRLPWPRTLENPKCFQLEPTPTSCSYLRVTKC